MPVSSIVTVHTGTHRQFAAFRGAGIVASLPNFDSMSVWNEDWHELGPAAITKWQASMYVDDAGGSSDSDMGSDGGGARYHKDSTAHSRAREYGVKPVKGSGDNNGGET